MLRAGEQLLRRSFFDHNAFVHHGHAIGQVSDDAHVVGDQHNRCTELVAAPAKQVENFGLNGYVERCCRLVGNNNFRLEHQRHRDNHSLLLAARKLVRKVVDPNVRFRNPDLAENLNRFRSGRFLAQRAVRADSFGNLPAHREYGVQRRGRLLKNHGNINAANCPQPRSAQGEHVVVTDEHGTAGQRGFGQQPQNGLCGYGLTAAALPHNGEDLAFFDRQVHIVDGHNIPTVRGKGDFKVSDF